MTKNQFDVLGIGNAIVDVVAESPDAFLEKHGLAKGTMTLIDAAEADRLYQAMPPGIEASGGSAANTVAGVASLGGRAAYIGKIRDDQLGDIFSHDIRAAGVHFPTRQATDGAPTARCLVFVTQDAQRTMTTYLGACVELGPEDIDDAVVSGSAVTYLEGYLWDPPKAKQAFHRAIEIAHKAGRKVALSLSDPFCVDRYRDEFVDLIEGHVDILFANEDEIKSLYQTDNFGDAADRIANVVDIAALTRSEKGATIVAGGRQSHVPAAAIDHVVDTTGAGDLYASGFLWGLTHDWSPEACSRLGAQTAAKAIVQFGARPLGSLEPLVALAQNESSP